MRLFLSYRRSQTARIDALVRALNDAGIDVWIDRNEIEDATRIQQQIYEGLANCHSLLA